MPPRKLTATEVAQRLAPHNNPQRLNADELEALTAHLSVNELQVVLDRIGLGKFSRQVTPALGHLLVAAQRLQREQPEEDDDEVGGMLRRLQLVEISDSPPSTPPSSPPPSSPLTSSSRSRSARPPPPARDRTPAAVRPSTPPHGKVDPPAIPRSPREKYSVKTQKGTTTLITTSWFEAGSHTIGIPGASAHGEGASNRQHKPPAAAHVVITGHGLAIHCGYPNVAAATAAFEYARQQGWTADSSPPAPITTDGTLAPPSLDDNPLNAGSATTRCLNVSGVPGNLYASFTTLPEAQSVFAHACGEKWVRVVHRRAPL
ncbi:hypothetical protein C8R43DRAFT_963451 [Mycena crocata]|nr:hypothetical protein C8R43DRAFT_963451 [Mycena crocata]